MIRFLVVDDNETLRGMLVALLTREGYTVLEAADGFAALEVLKKEDVDIAIIDIIMPEKDGIETIREVKALYPDLGIIAISGGSPNVKADLSLDLAKKLGAQEIIKKPFSRKEILEAIAKLVQS